MADIELQTYIAEIEELQEAEHNDEAVAHCRHILDYFPKNLAVYRLLGKGLLEKKRFDDATDIFYRVLSAAPDDFVAHVGLAIISEEKNDLDQAIGHMQRAFEAQSNNPGIHAELKRLYGRRDGVEPLKIRLTSGALARLYLRGGNYSQAISELQDALEENPDRIDFQVLMAQALWKDEQRIDAVEVCQDILNKLPFCLEINSILYEIWQSAGREDEATPYWQRVEALDPYLAHRLQDPSGTSPSPVPQIPRLDYVPPTPEEVMGVPEWVHDLGLDDEDRLFDTQDVDDLEEMPLEADSLVSSDMEDSEIVPDWLREMASSEEQEAAELQTGTDLGWAGEQDASRGEIVPDWLHDSSLMDDEAELEEPIIVFDKPRRDASGSYAGAADQDDEDLPDWLAEAVEWREEQPETLSEDESEVETGDWLSEFADEATGAKASPLPAADQLPEDIPDWIQDEATIAQEKAIPGKPPELPSITESPSDIPDWLLAAQEQREPTSEMAVSAEQVVGAPEEVEEEIPEWLGAIHEEPASAVKGIAETEASIQVPDDARAEERLPDWLLAVQEEKALAIGEDALPKETSEIPGPSEENQLPDWLMAAREDQPRDVETVGEEDAFPAVSVTEIEMKEESPGWPTVDQEGQPLEEEQEAAPVGEAFSTPGLEQPEEGLPDWLQTAQEDEAAGQVGIDHETEPVPAPDLDWGRPEDQPSPDEIALLEPQEADLAVDWQIEASAAPAAITETPTTPVAESKAAPVIKQGTSEESVMAPSEDEFNIPDDELDDLLSDPDDALAWLEQLAADQGAPLDELPSLKGQPDAAGDLPDWLQEASTTSLGTLTEPEEEPFDEELSILPQDLAEAEASGPEEPEELPEWLVALDEESAESVEPAPLAADLGADAAGLPEWLRAELGDLETEELNAELAAAGADFADIPTDPDEAIAWLEQLAAKQGAPLEELASVEAESLEEEIEISAWIKESPEEILPEAEPELTELPEIQAEAAAPEMVQATEMPEDMDEAMAWLESLAAGQGAPVEELPTITDTHAEPAETPAWLQAELAAAKEIKELPDEQPAWLQELESETGTPLEEPELPEWLREPISPLERLEPLADDSAAVIEAQEAIEGFEEPASDEEEEIGLPEWLREPVAPLEEVERPSSEPVGLEEPELPEWLREPTGAVEGFDLSIPEPTEVVQEPELPEWLREPAAPIEEVESLAEAAIATITEEPELPEWLREPAAPVQEIEQAPAEPAAPALEKLDARFPEPTDVFDEPELPDWLRGLTPELMTTEEEALEPSPVVKEAIEREPAPETKEPEIEFAAEPGAEPEPIPAVVGMVEMEPAPAAEEPEMEPAPGAGREPEPAPAPAEVKPITGVPALRQQLAAEPEDHVIRLALARALLDNDELGQALDEYKEIVSSGQELKEVSADLEQLLEVQPGNLQVRRILGDSYMKQGRLSEALEAYRQALARLR